MHCTGWKRSRRGQEGHSANSKREDLGERATSVVRMREVYCLHFSDIIISRGETSWSSVQKDMSPTTAGRTDGESVLFRDSFGIVSPAGGGAGGMTDNHSRKVGIVKLRKLRIVMLSYCGNNWQTPWKQQGFLNLLMMVAVFLFDPFCTKWYSKSLPDFIQKARQGRGCSKHSSWFIWNTDSSLLFNSTLNTSPSTTKHFK